MCCKYKILEIKRYLVKVINNFNKLSNKNLTPIKTEVNNNKKILIIPSWYPTKDNSLIGTFFQEQSLLMTQQYDVKVLFGQPKEKINGTYIVSNMVTSPPECISFFYKKNNRKDENFNFKKMLSAYEAVFDKLIYNGWKPDIIHAHCSVYGGIVANYLGKKKNIPTIITEHQMFLLHRYSEMLQKKIFKALEEANVVGAVSTDKMKFILMHEIKCNPIVIGNMVDDDLFKINKKIEQQKNRTTKKFNILIVAGASYIKDLPTFFYALKEILDKGHKDIHANILGNGIWGGENYDDLLNKLKIKKYCTFFNTVSRQDMPKFYQKSDVFVSTSIAEGFQVSALEAMACGKPVVSTSHGGIEDIISKDNGVLVKIRDYKAIADTLIKIKIGKNKFDSKIIRSIVISQYGKKAFERKISKIYKNVLKNSNYNQ